eukprot:COSAG02_NODE_24563_length_684_cov_0.984615_2_plen_173_part_01
MMVVGVICRVTKLSDIVSAFPTNSLVLDAEVHPTPHSLGRKDPRQKYRCLLPLPSKASRIRSNVRAQLASPRLTSQHLTHGLTHLPYLTAVRMVSHAARSPPTQVRPRNTAGWWSFHRMPNDQQRRGHKMSATAVSPAVSVTGCQCRSQAMTQPRGRRGRPLAAARAVPGAGG